MRPIWQLPGPIYNTLENTTRCSHAYLISIHEAIGIQLEPFHLTSWVKSSLSSNSRHRSWFFLDLLPLIEYWACKWRAFHTPFYNPITTSTLPAYLKVKWNMSLSKTQKANNLMLAITIVAKCGQVKKFCRVMLQNWARHVIKRTSNLTTNIIDEG